MKIGAAPYDHHERPRPFATRAEVQVTIADGAAEPAQVGIDWAHQIDKLSEMVSSVRKDFGSLAMAIGVEECAEYVVPDEPPC